MYVYIKFKTLSCHKIVYVANLPFSLEFHGRLELTSWMIFSISILPKSVKFANCLSFIAFQEASLAKNWQYRPLLNIKKIGKDLSNSSKTIHRRLSFFLRLPDSKLVEGVFPSHLQACWDEQIAWKMLLLWSFSVAILDIMIYFKNYC